MTPPQTDRGTMSQPKRIQRKRTKGWKMPEGAMYVGRPSKWGNPYGQGIPASEAVAMFRSLMESRPGWIFTARQELRGRDLACWCGPKCACHADVLLEIANAASPEGATQ